MLFHITATHSPDNCPGYDPKAMAGVVKAIEGSEALAKKLGVTVHFMVNGAPKHVIFALVEAEDSTPIALWTNAFPIRQDFDITPVRREAELAEMAKAMMAQQQS